MALLIDDVLDFLVSEGLIGGATGWDRAAGYLPPLPQDAVDSAGRVIAVFETAGLEPELTKEGSSEEAYDYPGFQVRGRGQRYGYEELRGKMGAVYRALHGSTLAPASGDPAYVLVRAVQSGPFPLGLDERDRPGMTWNFVAIRERETS